MNCRARALTATSQPSPPYLKDEHIVYKASPNPYWRSFSRMVWGDAGAVLPLFCLLFNARTLGQRPRYPLHTAITAFSAIEADPAGGGAQAHAAASARIHTPTKSVWLPEQSISLVFFAPIALSTSPRSKKKNRALNSLNEIDSIYARCTLPRGKRTRKIRIAVSDAMV